MDYVIYIDVLFILNFTMDFFILLCVRKLINSNVKLIYSIFGSVTGAIYSCIVTVPVLYGNHLIRWGSLILISYFIICISFKIKKIKYSFRPWILFYVMSFIFGGILNFFYFFIGIDLIRFFAIAIAAYLIINGCIHLLGHLNFKKSKIYEVEIEYQGHKQKLTALLDTGNSLIEPISRKPVNIIEKRTLEMLLGDASPNQTSMRIVPFHSLGTENGIMWAVCIDGIKIETDKGNIIVEKPMLGLYNKGLSQTKEYQMLLHPKLFN